MTPTHDAAVLIGRFQPFHCGHARLLELALATAPRVFVVLGSSFHARSPKNPFTCDERASMIRLSLPEAQRDRVSFIAVRDYYQDRRWAEAVQRKVGRHVPETARIALVGYFKDASSYYLNRFPRWELMTGEALADVDSTRVRQVFFEAEDIDVSLAVVAPMLTVPVRQFLKAWSTLPHYRKLVQEHAAIQAYRAAWKLAPFPPVQTTVDSVVTAAGHVLLVRRGAFPGKGLWALPGGFLEQRERLVQGAVRELMEETRLAVLEEELLDALRAVQVFDHPDRSQRTRTITHGHYFALARDQLPDVEGADDAASAAWIPLVSLAAMEDQFFDDHFHILDHFLGLTSDDEA
ncbi:bifunctional nicotinamide-nucleotide adenylyltransferase/Nudix hydroxylase [Noviherbaspirillum galbum]|uniref:Bifunctional nicotinamide-nucleotide adenylyltransferase/Nudix hydroxylase n=1 Tax=Noviherbaspirillum galbum TaxID=2709383 RepID=A0A6B3SFE3_9BURK|nr:bifunctional nicotinamide-nucleotide adenylyltransferase/Nudix hydroxylase [Noviherbaspirillum galbum]NEX59617.1 bifunctional nicotinamide-nucleotide adenylyltransferase/Nudix hydroxylase [Noviherbaspirillum galbum]